MPGDFTIDFWYKFDSINAGNTLISHNDSGSDSYYLQYYTASGGNIAFVVTTTSTIVNHVLPWSPSVGVWYHIALLRSVNNYTTYINGVAIGTTVDPDTMGNYNSLFEVGAVGPGNSPLAGNLDELRIIKGTALTADQIRQAYEYGLRAHPITIDFGATLQPSDLISNSTDYNFSITATTSGLSYHHFRTCIWAIK